jgi:hypothetical protein
VLAGFTLGIIVFCYDESGLGCCGGRFAMELSQRPALIVMR